MKDGIEYAEMLGLGVSSCDVVVKPAKRRRKKAADLKERVIEKVNEEAPREEKTEEPPVAEEFHAAEEKPAKKKRKFRFDIVYAEGIAVFALIVAILLTNIFWENSGINTVFRKAFGKDAEKTDARTYQSFNAKSPSSELAVSVDAGVMTFSGKGALYPVCDGKVSSVVEEDGKYTVTVKHSDVFSTVISGVDYVYTEVGGDAFKYIPIGYVADGQAKVYMYNGGTLVTDYIVEDGTIIWES